MPLILIGDPASQRLLKLTHDVMGANASCAAKSYDDVQKAIYCANSSDCSTGTSCLGICSDPDVSGFGVRYGFYLQAITNGLYILLLDELISGVMGVADP